MCVIIIVICNEMIYTKFLCENDDEICLEQVDSIAGAK